MKKLCERCHEEYEIGEIYPSKYFPYIFCIPCEKEYENKLWQFRINFINDQPERSKREDALKECEQIGHMNTWMPKNQTLCMRCGALNIMET